MRAIGRRSGRASVAAMALACGACSIVTSLDGLAGGVGDDGGADDAAPTADGASGGNDARADHAAPDATSDAAKGDATSGDDSATGDDAADGGPIDAPVDVGDAGFCGTQGVLTFCDDFDQGTALGAQFDSVPNFNGVASIANGLATSPPDALLIQTNSGAAAVTVIAEKDFASIVQSSGGTFVYSFDIRVVQPDPNGGDAVLASLQLEDSQGTFWWVYVEGGYSAAAGAIVPSFTENTSYADGGHTLTSAPVSKNLAVGAWVRVTIQAQLSALGTGTATLYFDGASVAQKSITPTTTNGRMGILVGVSYVSPGSAAWNVRYDDVTFAQK